MASTLRCPQCPPATSVNATALEIAIHAAYSLWVAKGLVSPNWWWNEIGIPSYVQAVSVLVREQLTVSAASVSEVFHERLRIPAVYAWHLQCR